MNRFLALGSPLSLEATNRKLRRSDIAITIASFSDVEIFISKNLIEMSVLGQNILDFDYVWMTCSWRSRSIAYAISLFLAAHGKNHHPVEQEKSKLVDMVLCGLKGVEIANTYFASTSVIAEKLDSIVDFCGYPFVVKQTRGFKGKDMYLVKNPDDFERISTEINSSEQYLCQRFIPNDFDYRVIVDSGEIASVCKRVRISDTFRNNTHLGAKEIFMAPADLPLDATKIAKQSSNLLNLNWTGVDIVTSIKTGRSYLLEINRNPGLTAGTSEISAAYKHILGLNNS